MRVALGASRERIVGDVLREALAITVIGLLLGLLGAVAVTRTMAGMLYGTSPLDPVIFVVAPLVLLAIGMLAAWFPARRASRVDPVVAIRAE
ncbi:MAG: FtsX-like permease family protein [Gemmatimonadales bacterium]